MAQEQRKDQQQGQQQQIQIKITDDVLKGAHANMMAVSHSKEEFILDFMNVYPMHGQGIAVGRIFITPGHMKRVLKALTDNIGQYEKQFGTIEEAPAVSGTNEIGFHPE
mgnify:CR=1 FL=1